MTDPTSIPNFPPPAGEHPLRGRVLDALQDLGLQPDIDGDGDVAFVVNDQQLFARCTEGEVEILRVFGQWQLPEEVASDIPQALEVCNDINLGANAVKTGVANATLVVTSEHIGGADADVTMLTQIGVEAVLAAVHAWHQRLFGVPEEGMPGDGGPGGAVPPEGV